MAETSPAMTRLIAGSSMIDEIVSIALREDTAHPSEPILPISPTTA
jgi:hypothetical protein